MSEPQGQAPAAQPLVIDPQELTLGALIGEGGFGKVLPRQPSINMCQNYPTVNACLGSFHGVENACDGMYCLNYTMCHACLLIGTPSSNLHCALEQVYYGAWRGLEVAIKVMSADITQQVAAGLEVGGSTCTSRER